MTCRFHTSRKGGRGEGLSHGVLCTWWLLLLAVGRAWLALASFPGLHSAVQNL